MGRFPDQRCNTLVEVDHTGNFDSLVQACAHNNAVLAASERD